MVKKPTLRSRRVLIRPWKFDAASTNGSMNIVSEGRRIIKKKTKNEINEDNDGARFGSIRGTTYGSKKKSGNMVKGVPLQLQLQLQGQCLPSDVGQLIDQLHRHCFAPDGSLVSKSAYYDLQLAREDMCRERVCYLEAMAIYSEAIAMVDDYHQGWVNPPQLFETLEHLMIVAEAAQKLRLPLISKDGDIHEDEIEKCSIMSRSSLDSTTTSFTISSTSTSPNYAAADNHISPTAAVAEEPGLGGHPNYFLGITPTYLWKIQLQQTPFDVDLSEYQLCLSDEIEARLRAKCDKLADIFEIEDIDLSLAQQYANDLLTERVKLITEEMEREEAALKEDLYSVDKQFSEYYNVIEQILGILIMMVRDLKLLQQHNYDELQKIFLCKKCETIDAKLRSLEYALLRDTYTKDSVRALQTIRKYLVNATKQSTMTHDKAVTRLHEYQGVDVHFNEIAREYHDVIEKLENMQWTIQQVEMDLKRPPNQPNA